MQQDVRWKQRFQNFDRAVVLLREPFEREVASLSDLEKEGTIQRFEYTVELAWKTLKDYLENEGQTISPVTPRNVVKEAFAAKGASVPSTAAACRFQSRHREIHYATKPPETPHLPRLRGTAFDYATFSFAVHRSRPLRCIVDSGGA
jgi:hypothetical protein